MRTYSISASLHRFSDDEDKDEERVDSNDPEEMFQNIQFQKEIIANIRTRPWPMRRKLKVLKYQPSCLPLPLPPAWPPSLPLLIPLSPPGPPLSPRPPPPRLTLSLTLSIVFEDDELTCCFL
uniref:Uncharacterized protein n=1 Tax=Gouania willdenowi TaxID=441366 RepID=A0A8C5DHP2_GOUWI